MRGMSVEMLGMVMIGVVMAALIFFMVFGKGIVRASPTQIFGADCQNAAGCSGNAVGSLCLSINGESYHCGCLTTQCTTGHVCDRATNRCK
jgi:hypothetical protein